MCDPPLPAPGRDRRTSSFVLMTRQGRFEERIDMSLPKIQHPAPAFYCEALMPDKSFETISLDQYKVI
jgi:hypothetical protein